MAVTHFAAAAAFFSGDIFPRGRRPLDINRHSIQHPEDKSKEMPEEAKEEAEEVVPAAAVETAPREGPFINPLDSLPEDDPLHPPTREKILKP